MKFSLRLLPQNPPPQKCCAIWCFFCSATSMFVSPSCQVRHHGPDPDVHRLCEEHHSLPKTSSGAYHCLWHHRLPHLQDTHIRSRPCTPCCFIVVVVVVYFPRWGRIGQEAMPVLKPPPVEGKPETRGIPCMSIFMNYSLISMVHLLLIEYSIFLSSRLSPHRGSKSQLQ